MTEGSIKQSVMLYLMERRLRIEEAAAVVKLVESDSSLGALTGRWDDPEDSISGDDMSAVLSVARHKALVWMGKYHEGHRARALFTGAS